ncbi:hypothetical protein AVEN_67792-1 [Araneus ventricosus]|uniref:Uncharacterized protein n=1 Tax=Araneus ventricosus TaxID=182803 RepID=A0A4Y2J582_ARAVE|nr:hypothetical protein AVEN_67792-1 [Araneus ventricosus]
MRETKELMEAGLSLMDEEGPPLLTWGSRSSWRNSWTVKGCCSTKSQPTISGIFIKEFSTFLYTKYTKRKYCNRQKMRTRDFDESPRFKPP